MNPLLLSLLLTTILWLAGCAENSWNAGLSADNIDFNSPNPIIPKASVGIGGKF